MNDRKTLQRIDPFGFTIIELMIAMAATLLIMGALTRAFGLVGNSIRDSRMKVLLTGQTRDLMFGIRNELAAATASNDPNNPEAGTGYLVIHEGPMADTTTTTFFGTGPTVVSPGYYPLSRWGDTDDYIAFTMQASKDSPFVGIVPWGVLEAARAQALGPAYSLPTGYDPEQPRVLYSQYAEICYWMAPRMVRDLSGTLQYESDNGVSADGMAEDGIPQYVDFDGDDYPDEFLLYRRILLVRPDLNVTQQRLRAGGISVANFGNALLQQPVIGYLKSTASGIEVEPAGASVAELSPGSWSTSPNAVVPNWLIGMARVQQRIDLSVAREFLHDRDNGLSSGIPASFYSASTIEQLRSPHRRFAHVMVPPGTGLVSSDRASMPLLALAPPLKFLAKGPTPPVTTPSLPVTNDNNNATDNLADRFTMTGHLRPEFALGGLREGDDIVGNNITGFDVKVFDPGAPVFVVSGADGAPGKANVDDNVNGTDDDISELGASDSDDQVVTPNDPYAYVIARAASLPALPDPPELVSLGTFVDIGYPQQAGGNFRFDLMDPTSNLRVDSRLYNVLDGGFSGIQTHPTASPTRMQLSDGLRFSGKYFRRSNGFAFVQPTFDSWTTEYETDNINQARWNIGTYRFNGIDATNSHYWIFNGTGASGTASSPAPGVKADSGGTVDIADPSITQAALFLAGQATPDVLPPIQSALKAVKISVRNYDQGTRQFGHLEVIHHLD